MTAARRLAAILAADVGVRASEWRVQKSRQLQLHTGTRPGKSGGLPRLMSPWLSQWGFATQLAFEASGSKIISASRSHDAETIAEGIAAKCDGWARTTFESMLTFRASVHCLCQKGFKLFDLKVDMNRGPASLISANFVGSLGRPAPSRFLDQSDLRVTTFENDVFRHRSSDLGQSQGVAIKSQAFIEQRNVN
jgi:hypothetical protein